MLDKSFGDGLKNRWSLTAEGQDEDSYIGNLIDRTVTHWPVHIPPLIGCDARALIPPIHVISQLPPHQLT